MLEMFKGVANSPETTITNNISETDTLIYVLDETRIPELPNLMVLGTGTSAETIKVLSIEGNAITVERGFQGVPRSWNAGTIIARNFTEYDYNALVENVKTLKGNTDTNAGDILSLMNYVGNLENLDTVEKSNIVLALNEIYQDLVAHKAEDVSQVVTAVRDISLTGEQIITGFVKKPKALTIFAGVQGTSMLSWGMCDSNNVNRHTCLMDDGIYMSVGNFAVAGGTNQNNAFRGEVKINNDGTVTILWSKTGNTTGTLLIRMLAHYHGSDE